MRSLGAEFAVEHGASNYDEESGFGLDHFRLSLSARWGLLGNLKEKPSHRKNLLNYQVYIKGGMMWQYLDVNGESVDRAKNLTAGLGVTVYINELISLNTEVRYIAPSFSQDTGVSGGLHESDITFHMDLGIHFENPLWYLAILLSPALFF